MNELEKARRNIPVTAQRIYLNTGGVGPVTQIYADTLAAFAARDLERGRAHAERFAAVDAALEAVRREVAALLRVERHHVFLTRSTGAGLEWVVNALALAPGDEIVSTTVEHHACSRPVAERAERAGARLRIAALTGEASVDVERFAALITERTRLVVLSAVAFESGQRLPVAEVARLARAAGAQTLIDGAQCAGAADLDLMAQDVDFCAIPLQKWLCGPEGLGALFVRSPEAHGLDYPPRDIVTHGLGILEAAAANLAWMREALGWDWIFERTASLAGYTRDAVEAIEGLELLTPDRFVGLTAVRCPAAQADNADELMFRRGFVLRHLPELGAFRLSTAFFNDESEIDAFLSSALDASGD